MNNKLLVFLLIFFFLFSPVLGVAKLNTPMYLPAVTHMKRIGTGEVTFHLRGIHDPPYFDAFATSNCLLLATGRLTCKSAVVEFNADWNDGELRIKREGKIHLYPGGQCSGYICDIGFGEDMHLDETRTEWHWNGVTWEEDYSFNISQAMVHEAGLKLPIPYNEKQDTYIGCNDINELCFSFHLVAQ